MLLQTKAMFMLNVDYDQLKYNSGYHISFNFILKLCSHLQFKFKYNMQQEPPSVRQNGTTSLISSPVIRPHTSLYAFCFAFTHQKVERMQFPFMKNSKHVVITGLEIATNTVAFATKFFPLRLKYLRSRKFATCCHLRSFETKGFAVATFAATFAKINK